jgi:hypothetical protein
MQIWPCFIAKITRICDNIRAFETNLSTPMDNDPELDSIRKEVDEDALLEDLADELTNGDPDEALERMEELGYDVDDLPL